MGNFQGGGNRGGGGGFRGGNGGGKPSFQKKSWGNDRGGDRQMSMHSATCSECGKGCEVPFRPTGEKPVYCSNCFSTKREGGDSSPRKEFSDRGTKREFNNDRPAPRTDFTRPVSMPSNDDTKKQLSEISMKLDRLINAMTRLTEVQSQAHTAKAPVVKAPVAPVKVEAKKAPVKVVAKKTAPAKSTGKKVVAKKKK